MIGAFLASAGSFLSANLWRTAAIIALVALLSFGAVRSCDRRDAIDDARDHGARVEREQANEKVLSDAEKIAVADSATRGGNVIVRMREDANCRDCADSE